MRGESSLFIGRRAHGLLKEGAPHVGEWAAKCLQSSCQVWDEGCHLSHTLNMCQFNLRSKERAPSPWLMGCHLKRAPPLQEGRTSQGPQAQSKKDIQSINLQSSRYGLL